MPLVKNLYRGFSSQQFSTRRSFHVADVKCVETDILNHIFTRRGERVMMPTFGTIIPDLAFEPLDDTTLSIVRDEINTVITSEPRVTLITMGMVPNYETNRLDVEISLFYIELNVQGLINFNITFEDS